MIRRFSWFLVSCLLAAAGPRATAHDFNGDGFDDVAIRSSNAVTVLFGANLTGLSTASYRRFTPNSFGLDASAGLGIGLAAGDFDGDGFSDLAMGTPNVNVQGHLDAGCVIVLRGAPTGFDESHPEYWTEDTPGLPGESQQWLGGASDQFGVRVAAGDFDGDGFDDLAVSDNGNFDELLFCGEVTVIRGSATGLTAVKSRRFRQGSKGVDGQPVYFGVFGGELATGDLNGDGRDELLIWSAGGTNGEPDARGQVSILFGGKKGLTGKTSRLYSAFDFGEDGVDFDGFTDVGVALAVGEFGDGKRSLVVSDEGHSSTSGQACIVPLKAGRKKLDLAARALWTQATVDPGQAVETGDRFSSSFATGDFDDDGFLDLAIGSWGETLPAKSAAGLVQVLRGSTSGLAAPGTSYTQDSAGVPGPSQGDAWLGYAIASGDFNGDGIADLAVTAPFFDVGMTSGAGTVVQLLGSASGLGSGTLITEPIGAAAFAQFGSEVTR